MLGTIVALIGAFLAIKLASALPRKLKTKCSPETFKKYRLIVLAGVFVLMTAGIAASLSLGCFLNVGQWNIIGSLGAAMAITVVGFGWGFINKALDILWFNRRKPGSNAAPTPEDRRKGFWLLAAGLSLFGSLIAVCLILL